MTQIRAGRAGAEAITFIANPLVSRNELTRDAPVTLAWLLPGGRPGHDTHRPAPVASTMLLQVA
jgi:hypothetical protein